MSSVKSSFIINSLIHLSFGRNSSCNNHQKSICPQLAAPRHQPHKQLERTFRNTLWPQKKDFYTRNQAGTPKFHYNSSFSAKLSYLLPFRCNWWWRFPAELLQAPHIGISCKSRYPHTIRLLLGVFCRSTCKQFCGLSGNNDCALERVLVHSPRSLRGFPSLDIQ